MANQKILGVVRASTVRQEVVSQQQDLQRFVESKGFKPEDIIWLVSAGASARSVNQKYLDFLEDIKRILEEQDIKTVAFWSMSRLGRREEYLQHMKQYFADHHVQCYIKEPSVTLLNNKGELDPAASVTFSVFAATVAIETAESHERMKRGKQFNKERGIWNGGQVAFGYGIDENGHYVINETEASIVRDILTLYSTGKYSIMRLWKELKARGIKKPDGSSITTTQISHLIREERYCGLHPYPAIISTELYEHIRTIREGANTSLIKTERVILGSHIWKCPECGHNLIECAGYYRCNHFYQLDLIERCNHSNTYCSKHIDVLLYHCALKAFLADFAKDREEQKRKAEEDIKVLEQKIITAQEQIEDISQQIKDITDAFIERIFTKSEYQARKAKVQESEKTLKDAIRAYQERIENIRGTFLQDSDMKRLQTKYITNGLTATDKDKQDLIRRYIDHGELHRVAPNDIRATVIMKDGTEHVFYYHNKAKKHKLYHENDRTPFVPIQSAFTISGIR